MLLAILLILIVIKLVMPTNSPGHYWMNIAIVVVLVLCLVLGWGADWPRLRLGTP